MAHTLCEGPFAPFTIQQAGSTTSPMIDRGPTLAAAPSAFVAFAVVAFAVVAFAVALPVAAPGALAGAGLGGVTWTVPVVAVPCAPARVVIHAGTRDGTSRARVIRAFIQPSTEL